MALSFDSAIDRPLVANSRHSERYLMLTVSAPEGGSHRAPLNLALVIDASGSMDGEKIARAKEAAGFVVRHLSLVDHVAIIAYNDDVTIVAPSTLTTAAAKTDLLYRINRVDPGGMTNLSGGWLTGCQEVARQPAGDDQHCRSLVLTDGLANVGITRLEELVEHARQLRARGISTSTMGVGADFNEELLEALARHGGGRFQYVETARHIPDCVQGELGEMLQVAARKLAIEVRLPPTAHCVECLNDYVRDDLADGVRFHLGDVAAGEVRHVVLKLAVDPVDNEAPRAISALALYVDAETGRGTESAFPTAALQVADLTAVDNQVTHDEVAQEVALLLAARAKEEAARLSRQGDPAGAQRTLATATAALGASPIAAAAPVASAISALNQLAADASEGLDPRQVKELHYQSYLAKQTRRRYDLPK